MRTCQGRFDNVQEKQAKAKLGKAMGEFVQASDLRLWMCDLMTTEHTSDHGVMQKVAESLQKETHMASYESQIRQDQKIAGVVVRECSISKQLDIVGTSVPKLEHLLQSFSSRIIESTKEQFVQVTQAIETNAKSLADSLADVQVNILEAAQIGARMLAGAAKTTAGTSCRLR